VQLTKSAPAQGGSETILLVEDDDAVRKTIGQTLRLLGYTVHEANDGRAALEFWHTGNPRVDMLVTDMVMPNGVSGLDLIERLHAIKPELKALLMSGYSEKLLKNGAPDKAGVAFLAKPCRASVLGSAVRQLLDQKN
jgi:CheY-like chemotaxis protein